MLGEKKSEEEYWSAGGWRRTAESKCRREVGKVVHRCVQVHADGGSGIVGTIDRRGYENKSTCVSPSPVQDSDRHCKKMYEVLPPKYRVRHLHISLPPARSIGVKYGHGIRQNHNRGFELWAYCVRRKRLMQVRVIRYH